MQNPFLVGPRVYLRAPEVTDADRLARFVTRPEVRPFLCRAHPLNRVQEEEWVRNLGGERDVVLLIALREGDRPIGCTGLHGIDPIARAATFGITIGEPDCWGQGYGREATELLVGFGFDELNLNRIALEVFATNPRAIACYEKVGFVHEGTQRQARFVQGQHVDAHLMAVLRSEWRARGAG